MASSYFTKAEKAEATALRFGMRVVRELRVWDASKAEHALFGDESEFDDWSFNKPYYAKFIELKTKEAFMGDLAEIYAKVAPVCDRGMAELPAEYALPRKRKSPLLKYADFVDNFDAVSNNMQELRLMCDVVASYVWYVELVEV
jgi:hypothetical protein